MKTVVIPVDFDPSATVRHDDNITINWDDTTVCVLCGKSDDCNCYKYRCDECNDFVDTCKCWNEVCAKCNTIIAHCKCSKD